ncbi:MULTISPECIES: VOC family protein [unclassified Ornithinimicrobium]|uniref:VOC family protein n=1 Tax=unclassified Ornithinimicrobium TaxID=2615080 RepID=UPI0038532C52
MADAEVGPSQLSVQAVTVDCEEPAALAEFWGAALGAEVREAHGDDLVVVAGTPSLAFQRVEQPPTSRNRIHLDLTGGERPHEVARLVELGASVVETRERDGSTWTILTDPAGNTFCVGAGHGAQAADGR